MPRRITQRMWDKMQHRQAEYALLGFILALSAWLFSRPLGSYDIWWQMAAARSILQTGHFPRTDTFSYTIENVPWFDFQWLSQMFFYAIYRIGEVSALVWLCIALNVATLIITHKIACLRSNHPHLSLMILPFTCAGLFTRYNLGPEHLFFVCLAGTIAILEAWQRGRSWMRWLLIPMQVFIANLHGGMMLVSLTLIAIYLLSDLFLMWRSKKTILAPLKSHGLLFGTIVLAMFLTPLGWNIFSVFQEALSYDNTLVQNTDWLPLKMSDFSDPERGFGYRAFLTVAILTAFGLILQGRKMRLVDGLSFVCFLMLAIQRRRMVAQFMMVASPICVEVISTHLSYLNKQRWIAHQKKFWHIAKMILPIFCSMALLYSPAKAATLGRRFDLIRPGFPVGAVEWVRKYRPVGNVWHPYHIGGYLIWHLWPDYRVMLDGRDHPYHKTGMSQKALEALNHQQAFDRFVQEYRVTFAILPNSGNWMALHQTSTPLSHFAKNAWALVYHDDDASVFLKRTPEHRDLIAAHEYRWILPQYQVQYVDRLNDPFQNGTSELLKETERLLTDSPNMSEANLLRGRYFETKAGQDFLPMAETCYRLAIEDLPWSLTGYYLLFDFYINSRQKEKACQVLAQAREAVYYQAGLAPMEAHCR